MKNLKATVNRIIAEEHLRMDGVSKETPSSPYEAYALLLKSVEETGEDYFTARNWLSSLWDSTTNEVEADVVTDVEQIRKHMLLTACNAIQTCAMCEKTLANLYEMSKPTEVEDLRKRFEEVLEVYD